MVFLALTLLTTLLAMWPYNLEGRIGRFERQSLVARGYFLTNIFLGITPWLLMMGIGVIDFIALLTSFLNMGLAAAAVKSNKPDEGAMILDWARPTNIFRGATTYFIVPIRQSSQKESTKKVDFDVTVKVPFPKIGLVSIKGSFPFVIDTGSDEQDIQYTDENGRMRVFHIPYRPARVREFILADRADGVKAQYGTRIAQIMQQYFQALSDELSREGRALNWEELRRRIYGAKEINGKLEQFLLGQSIPDTVLAKVGWPDVALNLGVAFLQIMIDIELPEKITSTETEIGMEQAQKEVERINAQATAQAAKTYLSELGVPQQQIEAMSAQELIQLGLELKKLRLAEQAESGAEVKSISNTFRLDISESVKEALPTAAEIAKAILPFLKKETGKASKKE